MAVNIKEIPKKNFWAATPRLRVEHNRGQRHKHDEAPELPARRRSYVYKLRMRMASLRLARFLCLFFPVLRNVLRDLLTHALLELLSISQGE